MNMTDIDGIDLNALLQNIKPNIVTPKLDEVVAVSNQKKPKTIAHIIVKAMHASLDNPVTKDVVHNGVIHKIKYFDIEPLMSNIWPSISLMILQLSYGEQCTIIEAIYPEKIQLTAKAFAINFTPDVATTNIKIENDSEITDKLDSVNAGIATIMAMLRKQGTGVAHPDQVKREMAYMKDLVTTERDSRLFAEQTKRAQDAAKYRDGFTNE